MNIPRTKRIAVAACLLALLPSLALALPPGLREENPPWAMPDLSLRDMEGRHWNADDLRDRVVVVNFWATWCNPCIREMPALQRAWETLRNEGILILAVNAGETREQVARFLDHYPVSFPLLLDRDSIAMAEWHVQAMPTSYVVNRDGSVILRVIGEYAWDSPEMLTRLRQIKTATQSP
jgi:peroxiredoxin